MITRKAKGGKARQRQLDRQRRAAPSQLLELANAVCHPRPRRAPADKNRVLEFLVRDVAGVQEFLRSSGLSHSIPRDGYEMVLLPIAYAALTLGRMIDIGRAERRRIKVAIDGEDFLRQLGSLKPCRDQRANEAWAMNSGVAAEVISAFLHAPAEWCQLIRRCENPRCQHPYFLQRSVRKARFCPGRCRQEAHERRRASDE